MQLLRELHAINEAKVGAVKDLTPAQQEKLLRDFKKWSGGVDVIDCAWTGDDKREPSVSSYIEHDLPSGIPYEGAVKFLKGLCESTLEESTFSQGDINDMIYELTLNAIRKQSGSKIDPAIINSIQRLMYHTDELWGHELDEVAHAVKDHIKNPKKWSYSEVYSSIEDAVLAMSERINNYFSNSMNFAPGYVKPKTSLIVANKNTPHDGEIGAAVKKHLKMDLTEAVQSKVSPVQTKIYHAIDKVITKIAKWEQKHHEPLTQDHLGYGVISKRFGNLLKAAALEGKSEFDKTWSKFHSFDVDIWALFADMLFNELGAKPPKHDFDPDMEDYDKLFKRLGFNESVELDEKSVVPHQLSTKDSWTDIIKALKADSKVSGIDVKDDEIKFKRRDHDFLLKGSDGKFALYVIVDGDKIKLRSAVSSAVDVLRAAIFTNETGTHYPQAK